MLTQAFLRGIVLPAAEHFTRTRFWSSYKESLQFDTRDAAWREAVRDQRLCQVLNTGLNTALHRERLERAGLDADPVTPADGRALLMKLPPLTKAELRRHSPAGALASADLSDCRFLSTAGTTDRLTVLADFAKRDQRRSSELRVLRMILDADVGVKGVDIPPNACNVVCGLVDEGPESLGGYLWHALRKRTLFSREGRSDLRGRFERRVLFRRRTLPPIDPAPALILGEVLDHYLSQLAQLRPIHLRGFPVYLLWLADRWRGRGPNGPRVVSPYGGLASPEMVKRIEAGLGAHFAGVYGTSELGSVAASCGHSPGMHLFEDQFLVEVLREGRPVEVGQVGSLAITDLTNTAMPLIRYEVGDVGRLHTSACPCGRETARLEVLGRVQEVLEGPDGPLTASATADTFFADPAVANFRLEEVTPSSFAAVVVAVPGGGTPDLDGWRERFASLHKGADKIRARLVPFVQPESSGKYRFVRPVRKEGAFV